jgi:hypothetical protein
LNGFGWNDIFFELTIGIEYTIDKKTSDDPLVHIDQGITPNKSTCRSKLVIVLEEKKIGPWTVAPKEFFD